jgi:hypothetical protein
VQWVKAVDQMNLSNVVIARDPEPGGHKGMRRGRCADCARTVVLFSKQCERVSQDPDVTVLCVRCARERMIRLNTTEARTEKD